MSKNHSRTLLILSRVRWMLGRCRDCGEKWMVHHRTEFLFTLQHFYMLRLPHHQM